MPPNAARFTTTPTKRAKMNPGELERLKKYCSQFGARIFGFWRGFGEGLKNPVTEPKRSQKPKRPLSQFPSPNGYSIFLTALALSNLIKPYPTLSRRIKPEGCADARQDADEFPREEHLPAWSIP